MGQYYNIYLKNAATDEEFVYDRHVDGEYTGAKLMEHSWWKNPCVNAISEILYKEPHQIGWIGDYADESEVYEKTWGENVVYEGLTETDFTLDCKYIVNHTKKSYLNCDTFKERNTDEDGWCIHPLPLLTVIGNGRGGGDYRGVFFETVGMWYLDILSIEDEIPEGYTESDFDFMEV